MLHALPGCNSFGLVTPNFGADRPKSNMGISVPTAVGNKGAWAPITTVLSEDLYGLLISPNSHVGSATAINAALDIGVDPAGGTAYQPVVKDLLVGSTPTYREFSQYMYFPMFARAGSSIAARVQSNVAGSVFVAALEMHRANAPHLLRRGFFCDTFSVTGVSGVSIVPGTTSVGAWALLGTTTRDLWWWQAAMQVDVSDSAFSDVLLHVDIAVGDASNKDIIMRDKVFWTNSSERMMNPLMTSGVEFDARAGVNVYARAQSSGAIDSYNIAAYGMGG